MLGYRGEGEVVSVLYSVVRGWVMGEVVSVLYSVVRGWVMGGRGCISTVPCSLWMGCGGEVVSVLYSVVGGLVIWGGGRGRLYQYYTV